MSRVYVVGASGNRWVALNDALEIEASAAVSNTAGTEYQVTLKVNGTVVVRQNLTDETKESAKSLAQGRASALTRGFAEAVDLAPQRRIDLKAASIRIYWDDSANAFNHKNVKTV